MASRVHLYRSPHSHEVHHLPVTHLKILQCRFANLKSSWLDDWCPARSFIQDAFSMCRKGILNHALRHCVDRYGLTKGLAAILRIAQLTAYAQLPGADVARITCTSNFLRCLDFQCPGAHVHSDLVRDLSSNDSQVTTAQLLGQLPLCQDIAIKYTWIQQHCHWGESPSLLWSPAILTV